MGTLTSVAGWLLIKVIDTVASKAIGRMTDLSFNKIGLFDATCENCGKKQSSISIPVGKPFPLKCPNCGHIGIVYIENLEKLIIHQVERAIIAVKDANIFIDKQTNLSQQPNIIFPPDSLPSGSSEIIETQFQHPNISLLSDSDIERLLKENAILKERLSLMEKLPLNRNTSEYSPAKEFQSTHGIIDKKVVDKAIREALDYINESYPQYDLPYHPITSYLLVEIRLTSSQSSPPDVLLPEIWLVPKSRAIIDKVSFAVQKSIGESLKVIGLALDKTIIRFFEDELPK